MNLLLDSIYEENVSEVCRPSLLFAVLFLMIHTRKENGNNVSTKKKEKKKTTRKKTPKTSKRRDSNYENSHSSFSHSSFHVWSRAVQLCHMTWPWIKASKLLQSSQDVLGCFPELCFIRMVKLILLNSNNKKAHGHKA